MWAAGLAYCVGSVPPGLPQENISRAYRENTGEEGAPLWGGGQKTQSPAREILLCDLSSTQGTSTLKQASKILRVEVTGSRSNGQVSFTQDF